MLSLAVVGQKNLPRKKRRKLQAAREMLEDEDQTEKLDVCISSVNVFYARE